MFKSLRNEVGFSMVEAVVAGVIFLTASVGVFATVTSMKPQATVSNEKIQAAYYGKQILAQLRGQVDATTWDQAGNNTLAIGNYGPITNGIYKANYTVTNTTEGGRRVDMTITW